MDDLWQLNLDGQQITQKVAGSGFGQPRFSRESIAEFQIVTNMFDITQGRSAGMEIQAISKSGTNTLGGNVYGYFRDDKLNAADLVANKVLPYSNQQPGGTLGGPILKDKIHYVPSYEYRVPGLTFGAPYNYPQTLNQNNWTGRVDYSVHREKHDLKIGAEYIHVHNGGPWFIQRQGFFTFTSAPANMAAVLPPDAALDASKFNLGPLNPLARDFQVNFAQNEADWTIDVPRPTYAVWLGDNWRVSSQLTVNLGVRWDADPNMASPPDIHTNDIIVTNNIPQSYSHQLAGTNDYGYKTDIR